VRHRLDPGRIDGFKLLDQSEDAVQLLPYLDDLGLGHCNPGQEGNPTDFVQA
jgi:hypothetical protein